MYLPVPPILRLFFLLFSPYEIPQISAFFDFYFFLKILLTNLYPSYIITLALRKTRKNKDAKNLRGVAQLGQSAWFGTRKSQVRILSPRLEIKSSISQKTFAGVVQWQNTSLPSQIRGFDSHHPLLSLQLSWIEQRPSKPWVGGSNPFRLVSHCQPAV